MTMPAYPRIISAIVLCLALVGLSSCVRTSEAVFHHAYVCDAVVTTENNSPDSDVAKFASTKVPVYKVGSKYYVQGEPAELYSRIGKLIIFQDESDSSHLVYASATGSKAYYEVELQELSGSTCCVFAEDLSSPLSTLPKDCTEPVGLYGMRAYRILPTSHDSSCLYNAKDHAVVRMDADERLTWRALYAYPAAGLLYVCVDLPGSIIMTPLYLLYEMCR